MRLGKLFDDIISLEKENMSRIYGGSDFIFSERDLLERLIKENSDLTKIIFAYRNNSLASYLRFNVLNQRVYMLYFQIKIGHELVLREMIKKTYNQFLDLIFNVIESEVYKRNSESLIFHMKMGFHYEKSIGNKISLVASREAFLKSLNRYIKHS
jgi:hypothetical protein